jgi:hypothetical protein
MTKTEFLHVVAKLTKSWLDGQFTDEEVVNKITILLSKVTED